MPTADGEGCENDRGLCIDGATTVRSTAEGDGTAVDANTVIAISATAIAVGSLTVSVTEARAARRHNRYSVRPLLQFRRTWGFDRPAGILLINYGLGPAIVTRTLVELDGEAVGRWDYATAEALRADLPRRPRATTFDIGGAIPVDEVAEVLVLSEYDKRRHDDWFWDLVAHRLHFVVEYESLYGERFRAELVPGP